MMPYEVALETDQQQRIANDLAARNAEADRNSDLYYLGEFDGKCRIQPSFPESHAYWHGYCRGLREYYLLQQGKMAEFEANSEF